MAVKELKSNNFVEEITKNAISFVQFSLYTYNDEFKLLSDKNSDIQFYWVNMNTESELANKFNIIDPNKILVVKNGVAVSIEIGKNLVSATSKVLEWVRDMDEAQLQLLAKSE